MKRLMLASVAVLALSTNAVYANNDLAKSKNCMACHAVGSKIIGPSYKDVALKYAGQKDAEANLVKKIMKGGSGAWGTAVMPANPQVSEAEAQALAKWILSQK